MKNSFFLDKDSDEKKGGKEEVLSLSQLIDNNSSERKLVTCTLHLLSC